MYLRHYASMVIESNDSLNSIKFYDDSSFIPEVIDNKIYLKASNKGFINRYIYIKDGKYKITSNNEDYNNLKTGFDIIKSDGIYSVEKHKYDELLNKYNHIEEKYKIEIASAKLRSVSKVISKKKRVVFIGTGKLGENAQYVFININKKIQNGEITDIEVLYFARNKIEKDYFDKLGMPCEIWSSADPYHIQYALQAKIAVFSTHTLADNPSNSFLLSCLSGAYKIQLWHGFLAKMVGCSILTNKNSSDTIVNMIEDCAVNVVTTALNTKEVIDKYSICFPGANIVCTGDARTDIIFEDNLTNIDDWCKKNRKKIKILFSPTYRESAKSAIAYIDSLIKLYSNINKNEIAVSVKFHPIFFLSNRNIRCDLIDKIEKVGINVISEREDSYAIMNKFDAMVTDYSSIRFDFLLTGKPVILFRPDYSEYTSKRVINPLKEFDLIDSVSYNIDNDDIVNVVKNDDKKDLRLDMIKRLGFYTDGKNSERVCSIILANL